MNILLFFVHFEIFFFAELDAYTPWLSSFEIVLRPLFGNILGLSFTYYLIVLLWLKEILQINILIFGVCSIFLSRISILLLLYKWGSSLSWPVLLTKVLTTFFGMNGQYIRFILKKGTIKLYSVHFPVVLVSNKELNNQIRV